MSDNAMIFMMILVGLLAFYLTHILLLVLYLKTSTGFLVARQEARSNHVGSPRQIGGVAIAIVTFVISTVIFVLSDGFTANSIYLLMAMLLLFFLGLADDLKNISIKIRIVIQIVAATLVVVALFDHIAHLNWNMQLLVALVAMLGIVYWVNVVNFMDGLDLMVVTGLGIPLLFVSLIALLLGPISDPVSIIGFVCSASLLGFAKLNWPPAQIFLGDSGSLFLGLVSAAVVINSINYLPLATVVLPFMYFAGDASVTLITRLVAKKKIFEAHSEHCYQIAFRKRHSRIEVVRVIFRINIFLIILAIIIIFWNGFASQTLSLLVGLAVMLWTLNHLRGDGNNV